MKSIIILLLFVGMFMVTHGIYGQKLQAAAQKKVEYKFIPRTYYEEQLAETNLMHKFFDMYEKPSPWFQK